MYKIGEFSILNKVTIKTLRYYDQIDLFKPKIVDSFTGYRYYDDNQLEEFNAISKYKNLNFSLDEIKELKNGNNSNNLITKKIEDLKESNIDNINKIKILNDMIEGINLNIKFMGYEEKYIIGKRITLSSRDELNNELETIKKELNNLSIKYYQSVLCNFEIGYEENNIDVFIGYQVSDNTVSNLKTIGDYNKIENTDLEIMYKNKVSNFLIAKCNNDEIINAYQQMIEYAHNNNIEIRGFFNEVYDDNEITIYVESYDLNEINKDEVYHLEKFNSNLKSLDIDKELIGEYKIREILLSIKYMFNENKQKSMLDTKYSTLILNNDGTTNFNNITWNKKELLFKYEDIIIPLPIYKLIINGKMYIKVLMNETYDNYKSQRPIEYLYERIVK